MSLRSLIKIILICLVVVNGIAIILIFTELIYHSIPPSAKSYKSFVLGAMSGSPEHLAHFKKTNDYEKLINASSVDSVRFYWNVYKHSE